MDTTNQEKVSNTKDKKTKNSWLTTLILFLLAILLGCTIGIALCGSWCSYWEDEDTYSTQGENVIEDILNLYEWTETTREYPVAWAHNQHAGRIVKHLPSQYSSSESTYLVLEKDSSDNLDSIYIDIISVLVENSFSEDGTRRIIFPSDGGAYYKKDEIWTDGTDLFFLIESVSLTDEDPTPVTFVFGYLGSLEEITALENEQGSILRTDSGIKGDLDDYFLSIDENNDPVSHVISSQDNEEHVLIEINCQASESSLFYFNKNLETGEVEPLLWSEYEDSDFHFAFDSGLITDCDSLEESPVSIEEMSDIQQQLIETDEDDYELYYESLFTGLEECLTESL
jgi:hypothetical protein